MRRLDNAEFGRLLTLADAYEVMFRFIEQYHTRGETLTGDLLGDLSLDVWGDGGSGDPVQLEDFLRTANKVLGP